MLNDVPIANYSVEDEKSTRDNFFNLNEKESISFDHIDEMSPDATIEDLFTETYKRVFFSVFCKLEKTVKEKGSIIIHDVIKGSSIDLDEKGITLFIGLNCESLDVKKIKT